MGRAELDFYVAIALGRCPICRAELQAPNAGDSRIVCSRCEAILYVERVNLALEGDA